MQTKLPVLKIILGAFTITWHYRKILTTSLAWPVFSMAFFWLIGAYWQENWSISYFYVNYILYYICFGALAITCHRVILLGAGAIPKYGINRLTWRETRFCSYLLLLTFATLFFIGWFVAILATFVINSIEVDIDKDSSYILDYANWITIFLQCT